ncbi:MAG: sigma-70 family RNA polymerase sigma factor [Gemmatimonadetes bacterium]|nr:sigma-70 family RNA polymerase sigma factor [Gemmatimonadota bacterium]
MTPPVPRQLAELLNAPHAAARNGAWDAFMGEYSKLLLRTAQRASSSRDDAMDRYIFILEQLQEDDFRRLRAFTADGRGKFTTWLVVVARRLCVDHHRSKYGRPQAGHEPTGANSVAHAARRNLLDLIANEIDVDGLEDEGSLHPDAELLSAERRQTLTAAVAELGLGDQLLLTLRFEDDISVEKIAPMIGLQSRFQVHRRLRHVLEQLRRKLIDRGMTES